MVEFLQSSAQQQTGAERNNVPPGTVDNSMSSLENPGIPVICSC
jgi:hypothetical protein